MPITPNHAPFGVNAFNFETTSSWAGVALREDSNNTFVEISKDDRTPTITENKEIVPPSPQPINESFTDIDAAPIQLWEGRVLEVDHQNEVMQVLLTAKLGQIPEHTAEIELQWVSEQDHDLVIPGAVFYLTLYKQTRRGSIKNSQELRFRRRPAWSKNQVDKIYSNAERLLSKMQSRPFAA